MIYLDYAASAPLYPQAAEELRRCAEEEYANPGGLHEAASRARAVVQDSRKTLAALLNAPDYSVFFTSGGTEGNNWALKAGAATGGDGKRHIVCGACEHKSVLETLRAMRRFGFSFTPVRPDAQGAIQPESVERAIRPDTVMLSVQAANNETGVVQNVAAFRALARKYGILYHCDAVQSFGHIRLPLDGPDLVTVSAHKLGGPRGVGCLVVRPDVALEPLIHGGGQESGMRSGTENVAGISAFARAASIACAELPEEETRLRGLRRLFKDLLKQKIPGVTFHGGGAMLPGIVNCAIPGVSAEETLMRLDLEGICASAGAACAARDRKPSHVLLAMGCSVDETARSVRFSFGRRTTEEEIRTAADAVSKLYQTCAKK